MVRDQEKETKLRTKILQMVVTNKEYDKVRARCKYEDD
jgi:hypothetical protein